MFAAQIGLRVILTMTNFYLEFGGIRWYVDNTVANGTAAKQELFYTVPGPIAAYKNWVRMGRGRVSRSRSSIRAQA